MIVTSSVLYPGHFNCLNIVTLLFTAHSQRRKYITWYYLLMRCSDWYVTGKFIRNRGDQGCYINRLLRCDLDMNYKSEHVNNYV